MRPLLPTVLLLVGCRDYSIFRDLDGGLAGAADTGLPADAGHRKLAFGAPIPYVTGDEPRWITVRDLNRDGLADVVTANRAGGNLSFFANSAGGTLNAEIRFASCATARAVVPFDIDGDGDLDLAVACEGLDGIAIHNSDGKGAFTLGASFGTGSAPHAIAAGEFDPNGGTDLVVANYSNSLTLLINDKMGGFLPGKPFGISGGARTVASADFDGDGSPDVATANELGNNVSVLRAAMGGFDATVNLPLSGAPFAIAAGDLDGDGDVDLAVACVSDPVTAIFLGDGKGNFGQPIKVQLGGEPSSVAIADLDGDGLLDVAVANTVNNQVDVIQRENGMFVLTGSFAAGHHPRYVAAGDLDGDGLPELLAANFEDAQISRLPNLSK